MIPSPVLWAGLGLVESNSHDYVTLGRAGNYGYEYHNIAASEILTIEAGGGETAGAVVVSGWVGLGCIIFSMLGYLAYELNN